MPKLKHASIPQCRLAVCLSLIFSTLLLAAPLPAQAPTSNTSSATPTFDTPLHLDGFRFIHTEHDDVEVTVFSNNGVRGPGLTLSFFGRLNQPVQDAHSVTIDRVILDDGATLDPEKIRTESRPGQETRWGFSLGADRRSLSFQVDLDLDRPRDLRSITGAFTVLVPGDFATTSTGLLTDQRGFTDPDSGVKVASTTNWAGERLIKLDIPGGRDQVWDFQILDETGNPFDLKFPLGRTGLRISFAIEKPESAPFRLQFTQALNPTEIQLPFSIENVDLRLPTSSSPHPTP